MNPSAHKETNIFFIFLEQWCVVYKYIPMFWNWKGITTYVGYMTSYRPWIQVLYSLASIITVLELDDISSHSNNWASPEGIHNSSNDNIISSTNYFWLSRLFWLWMGWLDCSLHTKHYDHIHVPALCSDKLACLKRQTIFVFMFEVNMTWYCNNRMKWMVYIWQFYSGMCRAELASKTRVPAEA